MPSIRDLVTAVAPSGRREEAQRREHAAPEQPSPGVLPPSPALWLEDELGEVVNQQLGYLANNEAELPIGAQPPPPRAPTRKRTARSAP